MLLRRSILLCPLLMAILPLAAEVTPDITLTMAIQGTLGPLLSGPDPKGINGKTGNLTIKISESATPVSTTSDSATYLVPAGGITEVIGTNSFTTTAPGKMKIRLTSSADILTVSFHSKGDTITTMWVFLAPGSWNTAVLINPLPFSPSPQTLTAATTAGGPGTKVKYRYRGTVTFLGLNGSASNSAAAVPDIEESEL